MSEYINVLKKPIENVLLFVGIVFSILGFVSLFISAPSVIFGISLNYWPFFTSGSIFLSIGISLLYLENKLTNIKLDLEIE